MANSSPQNPTRNRIAAVCVFVFCLAVAVGVQFFRPADGLPDPGNTAMAGILDEDPVKKAKIDEKSLFIGIRKPTPKEVYQAIPEAKGKPAMLLFHSQYCFDCKKMKPVLERLMPTMPNVVYRHYDILKENKTQPAVFNTFKPVTVPVLVFVSPDGKIKNVLYNYQNEKAIKAALDELVKKS